MDVVPRRQGSTVRSFALADEVVLTIRVSKTDQFSEGNVKNHFRAAGELCVIEALQHVQARAQSGGTRNDTIPCFDGLTVSLCGATTFKRRSCKRQPRLEATQLA